MDYVLIVVDGEILRDGRVAPAGWYRRESKWNGEEWIAYYELVSTHPEETDLPPFTYWEKEHVV